MKLLRIAIATMLVMALSSCQYNGWTRYQCQEFENWNKPECNPPQCDDDGICTKDLIGDNS